MTTRESRKIFISYAQSDHNDADEVVAALEAANLNVWVDRKQVLPGESFVAAMSQGLSDASYLVLLVSAASNASAWVSREWMAALASQDVVILPVLLESVQVPAILRDIVFVDLTRDRPTSLQTLVTALKRDGEFVDVPRARAPAALQELTRYELRKVANHCMQEVDFLAFLSDIDYPVGRIPGNSLHERLVHLILTLSADGIIQQLALWLVEERRTCATEQLRRLREKGTNFGPKVV